MTGELIGALIDPAVHDRTEDEILQGVVALKLEITVGTTRKHLKICWSEVFAAGRTLDVVGQKKLCISVCHSSINIMFLIEIPSPRGYFIEMKLDIFIWTRSCMR